MTMTGLLLSSVSNLPTGSQMGSPGTSVLMVTLAAVNITTTAAPVTIPKPPFGNDSDHNREPTENTKATILVVGYPDRNKPAIPPPPDRTNPGPVGPIVINTEEVFIVSIVLILWAAAIALFFNRWGKIRMLEPYQPKFQEEEHRPSCPMVELSSTGIGQPRTSLPKYNVNPYFDQQALYNAPPAGQRVLLRTRQNSVFAGNASVHNPAANSTRKTRSALDINTSDRLECGLSTNRTTRSVTVSPNMSMGAVARNARDRRISYAHHAGVTLPTRDRRSCSLFPPTNVHQRRISCNGECNPLRAQRNCYRERDSLSPNFTSLASSSSSRRTSSAPVDHHITGSSYRDGKTSFNNVIAQVASERKPSSSLLRLTNV